MGKDGPPTNERLLSCKVFCCFLYRISCGEAECHNNSVEKAWWATVSVWFSFLIHLAVRAFVLAPIIKSNKTRQRSSVLQVTNIILYLQWSLFLLKYLFVYSQLDFQKWGQTDYKCQIISLPAERVINVSLFLQTWTHITCLEIVQGQKVSDRHGIQTKLIIRNCSYAVMSSQCFCFCWYTYVGLLLFQVKKVKSYWPQS